MFVAIDLVFIWLIKLVGQSESTGNLYSESKSSFAPCKFSKRLIILFYNSYYGSCHRNRYHLCQVKNTSQLTSHCNRVWTEFDQIVLKLEEKRTWSFFLKSLPLSLHIHARWELNNNLTACASWKVFFLSLETVHNIDVTQHGEAGWVQW